MHRNLFCSGASGCLIDCAVSVAVGREPVDQSRRDDEFVVGHHREELLQVVAHRGFLMLRETVASIPLPNETM